MDRLWMLCSKLQIASQNLIKEEENDSNNFAVMFRCILVFIRGEAVNMSKNNVRMHRRISGGGSSRG